jgi:hypothetical protein
MSTDGPQPTQGAPKKKKKKKKGKSVGCFLRLFFCPLFSFSFFLEAPRTTRWSLGVGVGL